MFIKSKIAEGSFWIVLGGFICLFAWKEDLGSIREPGPGFVSFFSGLFILGIGFIMSFWQAFGKISLAKNADSNHAFCIASWFRLFYTMILLLVYALLFNTIGYILTTFLVMWGLFFDWENKNWTSSFLSSTVTTGVTYIVFEVWLRCQFPRGILPWW